MNKKAISGVVVAILILLIAVIAVSIFWFALRPSIEESTEGIGRGQECLTLNLKIDSIDDVADRVKVKREAGVADLKAVKVLVNGEEKPEHIFSDIPKELETKTYAVFVAQNATIEIAGVLEGDVTCSIADSATVT